MYRRKRQTPTQPPENVFPRQQQQRPEPPPIYTVRNTIYDEIADVDNQANEMYIHPNDVHDGPTTFKPYQDLDKATTKSVPGATDRPSSNPYEFLIRRP